MYKLPKDYSGPKPGTPEMAAAVQRITEQAIRDGRHSRDGHHVCHSCGGRMASIFYISPQTGDEMCGDCADKIGKGPKSIDRELGVQSPSNKSAK